jgi:uncharacterized cupredoxin-like copper-binding protein
MQIRLARTWRLALAAGIASLTLVGCGFGNGAGPEMMGGGSGYHFSKLTCTAPADLPGSRVNVGLGDMGMTQMMGGTAPLGVHMMLRAAPATVSAGQVSLVAANMGWRAHELVILPLAAGESAGQRVSGPDGKIDEEGSLGEASRSCGAGAGDGIKVGAVGWVTVRLAAGRYELVCNLANHYADGMHQELLVTSRKQSQPRGRRPSTATNLADLNAEQTIRAGIHSLRAPIVLLSTSRCPCSRLDALVGARQRLARTLIRPIMNRGQRLGQGGNNLPVEDVRQQASGARRGDGQRPRACEPASLRAERPCPVG